MAAEPAHPSEPRDAAPRAFALRTARPLPKRSGQENGDHRADEAQPANATPPAHTPGPARTSLPTRTPPPAGSDVPATAADSVNGNGRDGSKQGGRQLAAGRHRRAPEHQASYREVFAIREFRGLWAAQVLSYGGDQFAQVAIAILVYHRTSSPFLTALAYAFTYLPPIIGGPFLSGFADLIPRKTVMVACDVLRVGLVGLMAIPALPFPALCALLFCTVLLGAPFSSARTAMLPDVLPGDKFVLGSAIGNMTFQASQVLGFIAGAAVVVAINPYRTLALDSLTFALSAVIITLWTKRRPAARHESHRPSFWSTTRGGAAVVFRSRPLRALVFFGWLAGFYVIPEGLAAPYAHALGGGALTVGLLMAAMPIGTVISAIVLGRLVKPSTRLRMMGWLAILACAPLIGCATRPPLAVVLALWILSGLGSGYQLVAAAAFVQSVPDSGRALAFGVAQSGLLAAQGLGILIGGAAAQKLGPEPVAALAGFAGLGVAAYLALGWTHLRGDVISAIRAQTQTAAH